MRCLIKRLGRWFYTAAAWIGLVCFGILLGSEWAKLLVHRGLLQTSFALLGGVVLRWLLIGAHEAGHALAAYWLRFRIMSIRTGPVRLVREGQRLRLRFNRPRFNANFVQAVPTSGEALARRMVILIAAGPLSSL